jgi:hypothetical protein
VTRDELETTVSFVVAEGYWRLYSCIRGHIAKFRRLGYQEVDHDGAGVFFLAPKHSVSFRNAKKKKPQKAHSGVALKSVLTPKSTPLIDK